MNIHFYLLNEEDETEITTFYDMQSNPFKLDDELSLDVDEIYPIEYNKFKLEVQQKMQIESKELNDKFRFKKIKLVKEGKYVKFSLLGESKLIIEYHCIFVD